MHPVCPAPAKQCVQRSQGQPTHNARDLHPPVPEVKACLNVQGVGMCCSSAAPLGASPAGEQHASKAMQCQPRTLCPHSMYTHMPCNLHSDCHMSREIHAAGVTPHNTGSQRACDVAAAAFPSPPQTHRQTDMAPKRQTNSAASCGHTSQHCMTQHSPASTTQHLYVCVTCGLSHTEVHPQLAPHYTYIIFINYAQGGTARHGTARHDTAQHDMAQHATSHTTHHTTALNGCVTSNSTHPQPAPHQTHHRHQHPAAPAG